MRKLIAISLACAAILCAVFAVLDLAMPVMDGWGFLDERSRSPGLSSIPVIVLSGNRNAQENVAAMRAIFLGKPVSPEHLIEVVEGVARAPSAMPAPP